MNVVRTPDGVRVPGDVDVEHGTWPGEAQAEHPEGRSPGLAKEEPGRKEGTTQRNPPGAATTVCVADACMVSKTANKGDAAANPIRPGDNNERKYSGEAPRWRP